MTRAWRPALAIALGLLPLVVFLECRSASATLPAQTITGTIVGRVVDDRGAPIDAVVVRLVNLRSGFAYATRTDVGGFYRVELLPPSQYRITAEKDGFRPGLIERFRAEVNSTKEIIPPPITLVPIAAPPAAGPVEARLQANTSDAALRGRAASDFVVALPLGGIRSFDQLALLVPGVSPPPQTSGFTGPGIGPGVGTAGQFSVNGARARANNFTVDGSDDNDQDVGVRRHGFTPTVSQPVESVTEFEITTLLADAESGRNTGGQVNAVSRAGSNDVHGEAYAFLTDRRLSARDFFDYSGAANPAENPSTRLQTGALAGGPIVRDRLHAFGAVEYQAVRRLVDGHFATPTLAERNASVFAAGSPGPLAVDLLLPPFIPLPSDPGGPYGANTLTRLLDASGEGALLNLKVDGQPRWGSRLWRSATASARYDFAGDGTRLPSVDGAIASSLLARTRTHDLAFALNAALTERVANQVRLSFGRTSLVFDEVAGSPFVFTSPRGRIGPVGRLVVAPYSPVGIDPATFPQRRANNTFQAADTLVVARGSHAVKLGADVRRVQLNSAVDRNYRAEVSFTGGFRYRLGARPAAASGLDFAAFGLASNIFQSLAVVPDSSLALRFTEVNLFAHDSWRAHPRVTLAAGLRYERNTVPTDATGRLERELALTESDLVGTGTPGPAATEFLDRFRAQSRLYDGRTEIYDADANNVAPRAGLAWDVTGTGRVAVRAGYGLYYDTILGTVVSQSRNVFPSFVPVNFGADVFFPNLLSNNPALLGLVVPGTVNTIDASPADLPRVLGELLFLEGSDLAFTLPDRRLRTPYTHHYSVSAEAALFDRWLASAAYVGTSSHKLLRVRTPNGGPFTTVRLIRRNAPPDTLFGRSERPDTLLGPYTVLEGSANASYDALQFTLANRSGGSLDLRFAYTWSHAIDDVSDVFDTAGAPSLAQDEIGRDAGLRGERGDASFDVRHRFTAAWRWEAPLGVELSGIATLQTGQPFTVTTGLDTNRDGNLTDRLDTLDGLTILGGGRTRILVDPARAPIAFTPWVDEVVTRSGAVGRNTFRAAGIATLDLAASRRIALGDGRALTLRVEAFNALNRSHFAVPVRVLGAPGFGSSVATSIPARTVQVAVRFAL